MASTARPSIGARVISGEEIREFEGLFRAIYRKDMRANKVAVQKGFVELKRIRDNSFEWK
jgi:hypothetical protein